jgi:DNA (cytosine-5)-methyltransferase 1
VYGTLQAKANGGQSLNYSGAVAIPFDMTQVTSVANRQRLEAGREAPSLHAAGGQAIAIPISGDAANGRSGDALTPSPDAEGRVRHRPPSLGVGENGDASFTVSASSAPAIAFSSKDHAADAGSVSPTLRAMQHDTSHANGGANGQAIGFYHTNRQPEFGMYADVSPTVKVGSGTGANPPAVQQHMAVRRLTPTECCRLQAFPDNWLDLDPPLADSTKYRMLGNAVCVNVAEWIGQRIAQLDERGRLVWPI